MSRSLIPNPNKSPLFQRLLRKAPAAKLNQLREQDEDKAKEMENKMKWTNVLYKAERLKIKDDEDMLRSKLKKKEKRGVKIKKEWGDRSENIVEKMQKRQDKRRKNIRH
ncbi:hypothetical protein CesoFtcFv8_011411 [Champsocephalus esox]|uniref:Ribosomal RNA-processing protein 14/surfeit locus protein 6 C-terminal domain-containing protein n=2 Tax=Champsocephalus TaxID=52236 RepID=A0AAN8DK98_CHAGU|nr:hypothetical protein CesoFtcFv8_011411 [Champsocephalus esox]KAK5923774.1 hypothetical protein CgunFtcFv8_000712 [Champsocephalus gunnari]